MVKHTPDLLHRFVTWDVPDAAVPQETELLVMVAAVIKLVLLIRHLWQIVLPSIPCVSKFKFVHQQCLAYPLRSQDHKLWFL